MRANWCEIIIVREDTGKRMYHSAWITSQELTRETVPGDETHEGKTARVAPMAETELRDSSA